MEHRAKRLEFLRATQNADGGWGYFPDKHSWLEPTVYAALALARDPASSHRIQNAWNLVRSWQNVDGGWRPAAAVCTSTWCTALAITLADALGEHGPATDRGARWLLASTGAESSTLNRVLRFVGVSAFEREVKYRGWPWRPGTSAWVEPTAHALVALKKLALHKPARALDDRIDSGQRMLLSVRCTDGGWNYGSPRALAIELPSYPETTALALIGLQENAPADAVEFARGLMAGDISPLARAWLRLALGQRSGECAFKSDVLLCAIEALDADQLRSGVPW
jgi:hypothetical protein